MFCAIQGENILTMNYFENLINAFSTQHVGEIWSISNFFHKHLLMVFFWLASKIIQIHIIAVTPTWDATYATFF